MQSKEHAKEKARARQIKNDDKEGHNEKKPTASFEKKSARNQARAETEDKKE